MIKLYLLISTVVSIEFSAKHSKVDFAGLKQDVQLPVYFMYIYLFNEHGSPLTNSPSNTPEIRLTDENGSQVRAHRELLDRYDGSYIGRFRLWHSVKTLNIAITDENGNNFQKSPLKLKNVNIDSCSCPISLTNFRHTVGSKPLDQISKDFANFADFSYSENGDLVKSRFTQNPRASSLCHYVIKNQELFRKCYGEYIGFNMFSDAILLSILRRIRLPDVELWMNLGDWPQQKLADKNAMVVSWCGHDDFVDIVVPTYDVVEGTIEMMSKVTRDQFSVQSFGRKVKWTDKIDRAFFRGRDSRQERLDLAEISIKNPSFINASITNYFFFKVNEEKHGAKSKHVPFPDFFNNKFQVNIDGTVAAYRFPYLLLGNSLVFKQRSKYYEHFYHLLKDGESFIEINEDLSDLIPKIEYARANEAKIQEIIRNANEITAKILEPGEVFSYWGTVIETIASIAKDKVTVSESMEKIENKKGDSICYCSAEKDEL